MKILHINSYYTEGYFYKYLFDRQVDAGVSIDVFVPVPKKTCVDCNLERGSYTIISKNHRKFDRLLFHLKHRKILADIEKRFDINDYSILHAHSLFSNGYIAMRLRKKYGVPFIVAVRNTDVNTFFRRILPLRDLGIRILREADRIVFLSKPYRDKVLNSYIPAIFKDEIDRKSIIIPNGIDEFWLANRIEKEAPLNPNLLKLLQVGDINKNKNIKTTIKAVKQMIEKNNCVQLTVVGKIKDQRIYKRIKRLPFISCISHRTKEDLIGIYRTHDIFVLPSIHETFGLVYAEAMSQGLPVIYSKGQGFDDQFPEGEVGFHVDSFDHSDIVKKIKQIVLDYSEISERCTELSSRFSWKKIASDYLDVYDEIVATCPRR